MIKEPSIKDKALSYNNFIEKLYPELLTEYSINNVVCKNITFQVTEDCNLRCTYCYQVNKTSSYMRFETAKQFIDDLLDNEKLSSYASIDNIKAYVLEFIGGEPLLCIDLIDKIMDYWVTSVYERNYEAGKRYMISMSSNGTLYRTKKVQDFLSKWGDKVSLGITVDGNKELHDTCRLFPDGCGSFDLAFDAARDQLLQGKESSKLTFAPENIHKVYEACVNLLDNGWATVHGNCCFEEGWTIEHAKVFYNQLKKLADNILTRPTVPYVSLFDENIGRKLPEEDNKNWCGGNGLMLALGADNKYYPCLRYMPSSMPEGVEPYVIGDIETGIGNKPEYKARIEELAKITRTSQSPQKCLDCSINMGCAWCSAHNYTVFGTPNKRATFICDMHKARVLANVYFWNKYYKLTDTAETFELNLPFEQQNIIDKNEYELLLELQRKN